MKTKKTKLFEKVLKRFEHRFVKFEGKKDEYLPVLIEGDIADLFIFITDGLKKGEKE